ncbi:MAG: hypothetical protein JNK90_13355 [Planctomycetaceae bacterium]|nr:hypothetical protein [Planctomycetaceae bacterium]
MNDTPFTDDYIRQFLEVDLPVQNYFVYENHQIVGPLVYCIGPYGKTCLMCIHDPRLLDACVDYLTRMNMPVLRTLDEIDAYVANWPKTPHVSP